MFKSLFQIIIFFIPVLIFCQEKKMSKKEAIQEVTRLNNLLNQLNIENEELLKSIEMKSNEMETKNNQFDALFLKNKNLELELSKLLNDLQIEKDLVIKNKENLNLFEDSAKSLRSKISDIKNEIFSKKEVIDEQEKNINNLKEEINNYKSKISQDSIKSKSQEDEINIKINKIKELNLNLDSLINLLNEKNKRINNLKDSLILSVKQKKKKSLALRITPVKEFELPIISVSIKDDWYFLNSNSISNFVKHSTVDNILNAVDYRFKHYRTDESNEEGHGYFYFYKSLDDYESNKGVLFNGICYAYENSNFFKDLIESGNIDEKKIFNRYLRDRIEGNKIYVFEVKNGLPIEVKVFDGYEYNTSGFVGRKGKKVHNVYLLEHIFFSNVFDSINNSNFVLKNKKLTYEFFHRSDNNLSKRSYHKYFLKSENNYKVIIDWENDLGKAYESVLHGIQKRWSKIDGYHNPAKGYYLQSVTNYKNGNKHGYKREWKANYGTWGCNYNENDFGGKCTKHKYGLKYKPLLEKPRLVFEGNYYNGCEIGKHITWNYQGLNGQHNAYLDYYLKEYGKSAYRDSLIYIESIENFKLFKNYDIWNNGDVNIFSRKVGLQLKVNEYNYEIDEVFFKTINYDENIHYEPNVIIEYNGDEKILIQTDWKREYYNGRNSIKNESFFEDNFKKEEKEYWKNKELKKHIIYSARNVIEKTKCFSKKGHRIQCN